MFRGAESCRTGTGRVNDAGLDFYDRLVDALLENGIEPLVTLYHWDLPAALDDRGGWLNPDISKWFADYAEIMFRKLDGRVKKWATLNEPWVVTDGGYLHGALAPDTATASRRRSRPTICCARTAPRFRLTARWDAMRSGSSSTSSRSTRRPTIRPTSRPTARAEAYMNRQYLDPVFFGHYPKEMVEIFGEAWPDWPSDDFALIQQPIDFLGVNYYTRSVTRFDANAWPLKACAVRQKQATYTETGWEVFAPGLTETLLWVKRRYGDIPLYVTENGAAFFDPPTAAKGRIEDPLRVDYLREHIGAVARRDSRRVSTSAATWLGRCSTTWNGRSAIRSASASCTSTSQPKSARRRTARTSMRRSSPATELP